MAGSLFLWLGMEDYSALPGPHPCGACAMRCSKSFLTILSNLDGASHPPSLALRKPANKKPAPWRVLCSYGWGWRIRTSTYGVRVRCPAIRRIPSKSASPFLGSNTAAEGCNTLNVWRTEDAYGLCAGQPFYVRLHGHRGSETPPCAVYYDENHHRRLTPGQCRVE